MVTSFFLESNELAHMVEPAARDNHVDVEMGIQLLGPGMQYGDDSWNGAQNTRIPAQVNHSLRGAAKELPEQHSLVSQNQIVQDVRNRQDYMVIWDIRNDLFAALSNPGLLRWILTARTVPVITGSIMKIQLPALRTVGCVKPECRGLTPGDADRCFLLFLGY